jgi:hypothetical protein
LIAQSNRAPARRRHEQFRPREVRSAQYVIFVRVNHRPGKVGRRDEQVVMREIAERDGLAGAFVRAADLIAAADRVRAAGLAEERHDPELRSRRVAIIRFGFRALSITKSVDEQPAVDVIPARREPAVLVARTSPPGDATGIEIRFELEVGMEGSPPRRTVENVASRRLAP